MVLWEKLFNFLSAKLQMKHWETGHLPNPPASCLKFSFDDVKKNFLSSKYPEHDTNLCYLFSCLWKERKIKRVKNDTLILHS